jgi:branched-chain amino acid transport system permease protein/urea transport system permease protein
MDSSTITLLLNLVYHVLVLSLVALGLGMVFGMLGVVNMAQGEFLTLGAYAMVVAQRMQIAAGWGILMAILVTATLGYLIERWLVRPLQTRPLDTLLATWGLSLLVRKGIEAVFGRQYQNITQQIGGSTQIFSVDYPSYRLALMLAIVCGLLMLGLWYKHSTAGTRLKASVANPVLAQAIGIDVKRQACMAFVCGVACTGLAGALLAPLVRVEPLMGMDYLLGSFFVLVVGGLGSLSGLFAGAGIIGSTQVLVSTMLDQTYGYLAVLTLSIGFLWLRPHGLLSNR